MKASALKKRGWRYWRNLSLFALLSAFVGTLFVLYVGFPFYGARGWSRPRRLPVCCQTPADRGIDYEEVSFLTTDGLTLRGWYIPSQNGAAVILAHSIASNRVGMLDAAVFLARNGYGVLLFDLRAHGESDGDLLPFGGNEAEDVRAAAAFVQERADVDPDRIGAMGWSLGAQVVLLGTARTDAIQAVVADAPCCTTFRDWPPPQSLGDWLYVPYDLVFFEFLKWHGGVRYPLSVQEAISQIAPRPVLLIGGGAEQGMLEHHYRAAGEPRELWVIPEAGHIGGLRARPQAYEERVLRFFNQALLGGGQ